MAKTNTQPTTDGWSDVGDLSPEQLQQLLNLGYEVEVNGQVYSPTVSNPRLNMYSFDQSNVMTNDMDTHDYRTTLAMQQRLNREYKAGLVEDGKWGPKTQAAYEKAMLMDQTAAANYENAFMNPAINSYKPSAPINSLIPQNVGPVSMFANYIAAAESNSVYGADKDYKKWHNKITIGPYGIQKINMPDLTKRYGITEFKEFADCPTCQDDFVKYLDNSMYTPRIKKIRAMGLGKDRNDLELKFCQHNRGYTGCIECLKAGTCDEPTYNKDGKRTNMGLREYYEKATGRYHASLRAAGLPVPNLGKEHNNDVVQYAEGGLVKGGTKAVQNYQRMLNKKFGAGLKEDGAWGPKTQAAYERFILNNNQSISSSTTDISIPMLGNDRDNTQTIVPVSNNPIPTVPTQYPMDTFLKDIPRADGSYSGSGYIPRYMNNNTAIGFSLPEQVQTTGYPFPNFVIPYEPQVVEEPMPDVSKIPNPYSKENIYSDFGSKASSLSLPNKGVRLRSKEVTAFKEGKVVNVLDIGNYFAVVVDAGDGNYHIYNMLGDTKLKKNDKIKKGDYIGKGSADKQYKETGFEFQTSKVTRDPNYNKFIQEPWIEFNTQYYDPTTQFMYGGKVQKYGSGGKVKSPKSKTKYEATVEEDKPMPKNNFKLPEWYNYLMQLAGETIMDQTPGKIGDVYKAGKVGEEMYKEGILPPFLEAAKIPGPWFVDGLINFIQDNPYYNLHDLDKRLFVNPKPNSPVDYIKPKKSKNKS